MESTQGYSEYVKRYGEDFRHWRSLPWQVQPAFGAWWPFSIMQDETIGALLGRCAKEGREVSARETVDALFLKDGVYVHECGAKSRNYDDFIRKASRLRFAV